MLSFQFLIKAIYEIEIQPKKIIRDASIVLDIWLNRSEHRTVYPHGSEANALYSGQGKISAAPQGSLLPTDEPTA